MDETKDLLIISGAWGLGGFLIGIFVTKPPLFSDDGAFTLNWHFGRLLGGILFVFGACIHKIVLHQWESHEKKMREVPLKTSKRSPFTYGDKLRRDQSNSMSPSVSPSSPAPTSFSSPSPFRSPHLQDRIMMGFTPSSATQSRGSDRHSHEASPVQGLAPHSSGKTESYNDETYFHHHQQQQHGEINIEDVSCLKDERDSRDHESEDVIFLPTNHQYLSDKHDEDVCFPHTHDDDNFLEEEKVELPPSQPRMRRLSSPTKLLHPPRRPSLSAESTGNGGRARVSSRHLETDIDMTMRMGGGTEGDAVKEAGENGDFLSTLEEVKKKISLSMESDRKRKNDIEVEIEHQCKLISTSAKDAALLRKQWEDEDRRAKEAEANSMNSLRTGMINMLKTKCALDMNALKGLMETFQSTKSVTRVAYGLSDDLLLKSKALYKECEDFLSLVRDLLLQIDNRQPVISEGTGVDENEEARLQIINELTSHLKTNPLAQRMQAARQQDIVEAFNVVNKKSEEERLAKIQEEERKKAEQLERENDKRAEVSESKQLTEEQQKALDVQLRDILPTYPNTSKKLNPLTYRGVEKIEQFTINIMEQDDEGIPKNLTDRGVSKTVSKLTGIISEAKKLVGDARLKDRVIKAIVERLLVTPEGLNGGGLDETCAVVRNVLILLGICNQLGKNAKQIVASVIKPHLMSLSPPPKSSSSGDAAEAQYTPAELDAEKKKRLHMLRCFAYMITGYKNHSSPFTALGDGFGWLLEFGPIFHKRVTSVATDDDKAGLDIARECCEKLLCFLECGGSLELASIDIKRLEKILKDGFTQSLGQAYAAIVRSTQEGQRLSKFLSAFLQSPTTITSPLISHQLFSTWFRCKMDRLPFDAVQIELKDKEAWGGYRNEYEGIRTLSEAFNAPWEQFIPQLRMRLVSLKRADESRGDTSKSFLRYGTQAAFKLVEERMCGDQFDTRRMENNVPQQISELCLILDHKCFVSRFLSHEFGNWVLPYFDDIYDENAQYSMITRRMQARLKRRENFIVVFARLLMLPQQKPFTYADGWTWLATVVNMLCRRKIPEHTPRPSNSNENRDFLFLQQVILALYYFLDASNPKDTSQSSDCKVCRPGNASLCRIYPERFKGILSVLRSHIIPKIDATLTNEFVYIGIYASLKEEFIGVNGKPPLRYPFLH